MVVWIYGLFFLPLVRAQEADVQESSQRHVRRLRLLADDGGRVALSPDGKMIAFDRRGPDGYFDVWIMNADGTDQRCLTCDHFEISKNNGNPAFHPSGKFLVFTAENPHMPDLAQGKFSKYLTSPGIGINNDVWLINLDDLSLTPLTHVKDRRGCMHPHFSHDGTKLVWSEIISPRFERMGIWSIKLANFSFEDSRAKISCIKTFRPNGLQLYETHGFSPDDQALIFSGAPYGGHYYDMEIYLLDLKTKRSLRLTDNNEWDEHAHFTPDGCYIVWVSSQDIAQPKKTSTFLDTLKNPPRLDFWIMNTDGSEKRRLSYFNDAQAAEYVDAPDGVQVGDFDIFLVGHKILAKMRCYHREIITEVFLNQGY
ncbi:MAG: hypothetical protein ABIC68_06520 [Candidatus Omnitrophota bacterium]